MYHSTVNETSHHLIQLSSDSSETPSPPIQTVYHRSIKQSWVDTFIVTFVDNGKDRTDEVYKEARIRVLPSPSPEKTSQHSLPLLQFSPSSSSESENDDTESTKEDKQAQLWNAMSHQQRNIIYSERKEDLFSSGFLDILTSINPSELTSFGSDTIHLLLEICFSYLSNTDYSIQYLSQFILI